MLFFFCLYLFSFTFCLFSQKRHHSKCHSSKCQESNTGKSFGSTWTDLRHNKTCTTTILVLIEKHICFYLHSTEVPLVIFFFFFLVGSTVFGLRNVWCVTKREEEGREQLSENVKCHLCCHNVFFLTSIWEKQRWHYVLGLCISICI